MCAVMKFGEAPEACLDRAKAVLESGGVIAYLTESYYALGVRVTDDAALNRLFELKNRPLDKALPLIIWDRRALDILVKNISEMAGDLMDKYWPGPLTMIFEASENVPQILTGNTGKVAVRIPGESAALTLVSDLHMALTATSANPSTMSPASDADMVEEYFGDVVDLIIDSGNAPGGKPSTIIDVTVYPPCLLRHGRIKVAEIFTQGGLKK